VNHRARPTFQDHRTRQDHFLQGIEGLSLDRVRPRIRPHHYLGHNLFRTHLNNQRRHRLSQNVERDRLDHRRGVNALR
jgi:hypothetical protein